MKSTALHGLFWGIALIILGAGLMLRFIYQIHFPWLRVLVAFFFVYAGLLLLLRPGLKFFSSNLIFFSQGRMQYDENQKDYTILFGNATMDIIHITIAKTRIIEVNGIFSESVIRIGKDVNFKIKADAVFASFSGPDGNTVSFGSQNYQPPWFDAGKPYLKIKANAVLSSMRVFLA